MKSAGDAPLLMVTCVTFALGLFYATSFTVIQFFMDSLVTSPIFTKKAMDRERSNIHAKFCQQLQRSKILLAGTFLNRITVHCKFIFYE